MMTFRSVKKKEFQTLHNIYPQAIPLHSKKKRKQKYALIHYIQNVSRTPPITIRNSRPYINL